MTIHSKHYTYLVRWSPDDQQHIGLRTEFPSLSWLASDPTQALAGFMQVIGESVQDMQQNGQNIPLPAADKAYC